MTKIKRQEGGEISRDFFPKTTLDFSDGIFLIQSEGTVHYFDAVGDALAYGQKLLDDKYVVRVGKLEPATWQDIFITPDALDPIHKYLIFLRKGVR